jgi:hypothetical protein
VFSMTMYSLLSVAPLAVSDLVDLEVAGTLR